MKKLSKESPEAAVVRLTGLIERMSAEMIEAKAERDEARGRSRYILGNYDRMTAERDKLACRLDALEWALVLAQHEFKRLRDQRDQANQAQVDLSLAV